MVFLRVDTLVGLSKNNNIENFYAEQINRSL
jgi:hypothetical protein